MKDRKCRKCSEYIPWRTEVDGKTYMLTNRRFCLTCSPFKKHNTRKELGTETKMSRKYNNYSTERKKMCVISLYKRGLERKQELIDRSGGCCSICGYNKSTKALQFHHLDPSKKLFGLSLNNLWSKTKDKIDEEWAKCILVCGNCHVEIEEKINRASGLDYVSLVNKKYGTNF